MTTTSLNFREAAFSQETGRVPIALITLSHDDLEDDIRISTDPTQRLGDLSHTEQTAADWNAGELDGLEADGDDLVLSSAVVASGSIAAGSNKLDFTSDNAFIEFGVDISAYHGNHKIVVTDSAGKSASGYLHSVAPGGETLGAENIPNNDMEADPITDWKVPATASMAIVADERDGGAGSQSIEVTRGSEERMLTQSQTTVSLTKGGVYNYTGWIKNTDLTSGCTLHIALYSGSWALLYGWSSSVLTDATWTSFSTYLSILDYTYLSLQLRGIGSSGQKARADDFSLKRLTDCATTGALIVSTLGGSTRSWTSVDTGFNPNLACTYEISRIEGTRLSPPVDLTSVGTATGSTIEWSADVPENTTLTIYSGLSESDEEEPASWDECTSGESIPSVTLTDMAGKYLWIKQYMTTAEEGVSPSLSSISVGITGDYTTDSQLAYGTVSNGDVFIFLPVRIKLPDDTDEGPGEMQLEIDNVHRAYTETIRSVYTPVTCQVDIVMDNALDTIDASWPEFKLTNITYNATTITGTLKLETLDTEPFPAGAFVPSYFPGLF